MEQVKLLLQKVLALELQQSGFDAIETRALEALNDIVIRYILKCARNLRFVLDRYAPINVEMKPLWNMCLRAMHISLTELPLYAHHDVITTRQRLATGDGFGEQIRHEHTALSTLVHENTSILEAFQLDQPSRLRQRVQPCSPPRDYAYFDPTSVDTSSSFHQYSLDAFQTHSTPLPPSIDPTDPSYSYTAPYPYYTGSSTAFEPDKANFYHYVQPNALSSGSSSTRR
jgi:hypothetical protein